MGGHSLRKQSARVRGDVSAVVSDVASGGRGARGCSLKAVDAVRPERAGQELRDQLAPQIAAGLLQARACVGGPTTREHLTAKLVKEGMLRPRHSTYVHATIAARVRKALQVQTASESTARGRVAGAAVERPDPEAEDDSA